MTDPSSFLEHNTNQFNLRGGYTYYFICILSFSLRFGQG